MIDRLNNSILKELLSKKLPGSEAQQRMSPLDRAISQPGSDCREAAVLLLIYPDNDHLKIAFIKRNEYDGPHSGQISFPGGMKEISDQDFTHTALRETEEEIGVASSDVEILGKLTPLFIPVSNFYVHPFIGWTGSVPDFKPDISEVQYMICAKLKELADKKNIKSGIITRRGQSISTPYYDIEGEIIWGATAMIISEFMALLYY